ncbi:hypothetical protein [Pseudonocardia sp. KRD291]|uniref:hypothetical protein n=1 Tax=Pseudonocardia sp. KRD291 TaxID=2792007 RepID=UPI001C4A6754|nr:hypothetical protein [Pseudonocardia sp. KRD291]MBW0104387.1 hypothetical protein [Pseudonocardia sp. KRD291]
MAETGARRGYPARSDDGDAVHHADVGPDALVDPSGGRTSCGRRVMEVYNDGRDVTCPRCAGDA